MATRQRRLEIVIAWMQEHPGAMKDVQTKLKQLAGSYGYLRKNVGQLNLTTEEQAKFMGELNNVYQEMRVRAGTNQQTVNMLNKALKSTTDQITGASKSGGIFDKIMQRMGYRTSWVGFRMAIMGRLITRSVLGPMQKMIGALSGWEKSMETVALALALQEAGMGDTGMSAEELRETLISLAEEGPKVQTAMMGLGATWDALAITNAPGLITILGVLQGALEGVGGAIITSMVDAVADASPVLGDFLDLLEPYSEEIGTFAGYLLLAGIAMTGIGTAIYLTKPALLALQMLMNPILIALTAGIVLVLLWKKYWGDWAGYMESVVFPVFDRLQGMLPFWAPFKSLITGFEGLQGAFGGGPPAAPALPANQEVDVDIAIDIGNLASEIDVDAMVEEVSNAVTEALRVRGWP